MTDQQIIGAIETAILATESRLRFEISQQIGDCEVRLRDSIPEQIVEGKHLRTNLLDLRQQIEDLAGAIEVLARKLEVNGDELERREHTIGFTGSTGPQ